MWVALPPALGGGCSVSSALTSLAQQPDASATITRTLFVGLAMIKSTAIYCFVVSMILIFANPFWNYVIAGVAQSAGVGGNSNMLTVELQALNFLILVWLMNRFLYRPILAAIDRREKKSPRKLLELLSNAPKPKRTATNFRTETSSSTCNAPHFSLKRPTRPKPNASASSTMHARRLMPSAPNGRRH